MVIAYLISTGMVLKDALAEVKKVRSFAKPTPLQLKQLETFQSLKHPLIADAK
jgi:hypothetical protein